MVPVPSLFFIGHGGAALDIVGGESSRVNLEASIKRAIGKCNNSLENTIPSKLGKII